MNGWDRDGSGLHVKRVRGFTMNQQLAARTWWDPRGSRSARRSHGCGDVDAAKLARREHRQWLKRREAREVLTQSADLVLILRHAGLLVRTSRTDRRSVPAWAATIYDALQTEFCDPNPDAAEVLDAAVASSSVRDAMLVIVASLRDSREALVQYARSAT
jgi:hypothetical protein